jgi:RimJ/RimL family protein N-acetyltransferase
VSEPAPIDVLEQRLAGFRADFDADRSWRFGMFWLDGGETLGELGLFPRAATGRVAFADADRAEIGYWLRADFTGRGIVAEAASAVLAIAAATPKFSQAEIRCDARNAASVAVARRLGFNLTAELGEPSASPDSVPVSLQVWSLTLERATGQA